jgi:hypothetical protein
MSLSVLSNIRVTLGERILVDDGLIATTFNPSPTPMISADEVRRGRVAIAGDETGSMVGAEMLTERRFDRDPFDDTFGVTVGVIAIGVTTVGSK